MEVAINSLSLTPQASPGTTPPRRETPPIAAAPAMTEPKAEQPSRASLERAVEEVNQAVKSADEHLQFEVHESTHAVIIRLVDAQTSEVLREFPSKKFLDMVAQLQKLAGLHVDVNV